MQLSELFYSLQGEGPAVGRPSIFIRMSHCNLSCSGCDTKIKDKVEEVSVESVISRITNFQKVHPNARIVFTGGEPFLQPEAINSLIDKLPGNLIDVETNGTIQNQTELYKRFNIITISPKKDTFKTVKESSNFIKTWLDISSSGRNNVFFKFVVGGGLPWSWSESEILDVIRLSGADTSKVWLMPAGDNAAKLDVSGKNCWKVAARLNCNYSDRLHIRCGGR